MSIKNEAILSLTLICQHYISPRILLAFGRFRCALSHPTPRALVNKLSSDMLGGWLRQGNENDDHCEAEIHHHRWTSILSENTKPNGADKMSRDKFVFILTWIDLAKH